MSRQVGGEPIAKPALVGFASLFNDGYGMGSYAVGIEAGLFTLFESVR